MGQHRGRSGKRAFGINHPFLCAQWCEPVAEARRLGESGILAEELQLPGVMRRSQFLEETASEQTREHAHRQEEAWPAGHPTRTVWGQTAAGDDAMHVRVMGERRAPGVQHQGCADLRAQMLGSAAMVSSVWAATSNNKP